MYVIRNIEQIDLDKICRNIEISKIVKDKRAIYYGAYLDTLLIGFILALNTSEFLLITYIYTEENYRKQGVGRNLLSELKHKGKILKKRLCLKIYDMPNKESIISFFISECFSTFELN